MNAVAFRRNGLYTVGDYQFATYYDSDPDGDGLFNVTVARRQVSETTWDIVHTDFYDNNSNSTDGHNVISFGIDGDGIMHMAWGMHNNRMLYATSDQSVLSDGGALSFTRHYEGTTGTVDRWGNATLDSNETSVTYPEFYNLADGDLMYMYRNGASGSGDTFFKRYDTTSDSWSTIQNPLYDGIVAGIPTNNAYFNRLGVGDDGTIYATWTNRYQSSSPAGESGYQTNHNFYFAKSSDNGETWTQMDGTPYSTTTPITELTAELVVPIPEGSSLINQADMTLDANDNPIIASWWAPEAAEGNHNRQYMIAWYDGNDWRTSAVTDRTMDTYKQDETQVRELGRPIVVADDDGHVIVALRFRDNQSDDDHLKLAISSSPDRDDWTFVDLGVGDMGGYEPVYDPARWENDGILSFLTQPIGGSNSGSNAASSPVTIVEWDARAYFNDLEGDVNLDGVISAADADALGAYLTEEQDTATRARYDVDGSGVVDADDISAMVSDFFRTAYGDANLDRRINLLDLSSLASSFGDEGGWGQGDFNLDGTVDLLDLSILAANFGKDFNLVPRSVSLPEPASASLVLLSLLACRRRTA